MQIECNDKTLKVMQQELDDYIQQFKVGYFTPLSQLARLTEEVGELAREVSDVYGEKPKKATENSGSVAEELGDVLITTLIMANSLDLDMTDIFNRNMEKFNQRDAHRFERKEQDKSSKS